MTRAYGYKYDNLNRLKDAVYQKTAVLNAYNESLTYDKNGNIMSLLRNGTNETATAIDNLVYSYGPTNATNQLTKVADSSNKTLGFVDSAANSVDDYSYDANGNMTKDNNKNITAITYNHLNLPTKITFATTGNIVYIYNAAGQKVQKVVTITSPASTTTTDYLGGYQYLNTVLQFFPTAEGYVEAVTASSFKYVYQYKDHLGNVRLSYKDSDGNGSIASTEILEQNDYYPFGLKHTGYGPTITSTNSALKFKFGRKEYQDELGLNMYDFGARNYDSTLGRWMNMDALSEVYVGISPYSYTLNNPILFIDPDGNYVDDSYIYQKYTSGKNKGEYKNPSMVKAWEIFAKSKTGSSFLANFAHKGQTIAGEKFKGESGKYDKANIDLNFGEKTTARASAETDYEVKGDHLQITIGIDDNPNLASNLGDFIDDIAHEAFGHTDFYAQDFYSDRNIDLSNIDKDIVKNTDEWIKKNPKRNGPSRDNLSHHDQEIRSKIYIKKTFPILKEYYKNAKIKKTDAEIKYDVSTYPRT